MLGFLLGKRCTVRLQLPAGRELVLLAREGADPDWNPSPSMDQQFSGFPCLKENIAQHVLRGKHESLQALTVAETHSTVRCTASIFGILR